MYRCSVYIIFFDVDMWIGQICYSDYVHKSGEVLLRSVCGQERMIGSNGPSVPGQATGLLERTVQQTDGRADVDARTIGEEYDVSRLISWNFQLFLFSPSVASLLPDYRSNPPRASPRRSFNRTRNLDSRLYLPPSLSTSESFFLAAPEIIPQRSPEQQRFSIYRSIVYIGELHDKRSEVPEWYWYVSSKRQVISCAQRHGYLHSNTGITCTSCSTIARQSSVTLVSFFCDSFTYIWRLPLCTAIGIGDGGYKVFDICI